MYAWIAQSCGKFMHKGQINMLFNESLCLLTVCLPAFFDLEYINVSGANFLGAST